MFAGKTETLIKEARRYQFKKKDVLVFKPSIDNRWGTDAIRTHSGLEFPATSVTCPEEIVKSVLEYIDEHGKLDMVGIDEIQFFSKEIVQVVQYLLEADIKVVFAGLSTDFRGEPFGEMPTLLALSDKLKKPKAVCEVCGDKATRTQRIVNGKPANYQDPIVLIGAEEVYEPRCPNHHEIPGKPKPNINHR